MVVQWEEDCLQALCCVILPVYKRGVPLWVEWNYFSDFFNSEAVTCYPPCVTKVGAQPE